MRIASYVMAVAAFGLMAAVAIGTMPDSVPFTEIVSSAQAQQVVQAPPNPVVIVPWGDWLSSALNYASQIIGAAVVLVFSILARSLPAQIVSFLEAARVEQLIQRAVDYGIGATAGAVKGKTVDVTLTNAILRNAVEYAVSSAPALAEKYADTLKAKILARMSGAGVVAEEATAANLDAEVPPAPIPLAAL